MAATKRKQSVSLLCGKLVYWSSTLSKKIRKRGSAEGCGVRSDEVWREKSCAGHENRPSALCQNSGAATHKKRNSDKDHYFSSKSLMHQKTYIDRQSRSPRKKWKMPGRPGKNFNTEINRKYSVDKVSSKSDQ